MAPINHIIFVSLCSRIANERSVRILLADGSLTTTQSQNLEVGDIVHLEDDESVPADLVVLSTSHEQGQCFVMTANLDGETSLKTMHSATITKASRSPQQIKAFKVREDENKNYLFPPNYR